jgi:hypothetical protein
MPKIKPIDNENDKSAWDGIDFSNNQNKLWFSVDFLGRIGFLDKKEIVKLKKDNIDYLLVGIIKQEYQKGENNKSEIIQTTTTLDLLSGDFQIQKTKTISIEDIKKDYEETLFHIYIESIQSPQSEILRFIKGSDFLKVSTNKIEENLLFLLMKNKLDDEVLEIEDNYWHKSVLLRKILNTYDEETEKLMLAKGEYVELYFEKETNLLKKYNLAKKVLTKNPKYEPALKACFEYYTSSDNQEIDDFKKFYKENYEDLKNVFSSNDFLRLSFVFFLKSKQFDMCEEILDTEPQIHTPWNYLKDNINSYLRGVLYYEQEKYKESLASFKETVQSVGDTELLLGCHIYMFSIYLKLKDYIGIENALSQMCMQIESISMNDYFVFVMELPTKDFFLQEIQYAIKNNISDKTRLMAIYLFKKFLYKEEEVLSKNDKKEIIELLNEIKNTTKETLFDLYVMAHGFYRIEKHNNAVLYKLKYILSGGKEWIYTDISECSDEFLDDYATTIKGEIAKPPSRDIRVLRYFKEMFSKDIEELFSKKKYETVSGIYSLLEGQALELFFSPEEMEDGHTFFDRRFEIAYSLNEIEKKDEAQEIYESIEDSSSSVLNNLALIYEGQNDTKKAKQAITKAFELTDGSNKRINENKERILSTKRSKSIKKDRTEPMQKTKLNWSDVEIKFTDENNIEILIKGKLKKKGDYGTFDFKKTDDMSWEILRALSITKAKIQGGKEFYLSPETMFNKDAFKRSRDKKGLFQTYKSALSKALCDYFEISDEPIPYDKAVMGYNPILKITPTKELRNLEIPDIRTTQYLTEV